MIVSPSVCGMNNMYIEEMKAERDCRESGETHVPYSFVILDYLFLPRKLDYDILGDGENFGKVKENAGELKDRILRHLARYPTPIILCLPDFMKDRTAEFLAMGVKEVRLAPIDEEGMEDIMHTYCEGIKNQEEEKA